MTAAGWRVRPFEAADAEAVSAMVAALNRGEGLDRAAPPDGAGLRAAFFGPDPVGVLLVARAGDGAPSLAGYATGHATFETEFMARGLYMGDLYVAPEHRRHGVGRALVAALAAEARARGGRFLWWTARPGNAAGHAFYRAIGGAGEDLRAFALADAAFERLAAAAAAAAGAAP